MDIEANKDILTLVERKHAESIRQQQRGLIIQPGAVGDCILTLPLARLLKETLRLGGVDLLGHMDYTDYFPQRTHIDSVRSIDSLDLHRLFHDPKTFDLDQHDPLITTFADYNWILSFLGGPDSAFEKNLVYTVHCSHSAEIISLDLNPTDAYDRHITEFYCQQLIEQCGETISNRHDHANIMIQPTAADFNRGRHLLQENDVDLHRPLFVIHPGSGGTGKCWHLDNFVHIARHLLDQNQQVVFLLGPAESERWPIQVIETLEQTAALLMGRPLLDVLAVLCCADGFIGNDSGIGHLAAALGRPSCIVFGPTNPCVYRPLGPKVFTVCDPHDRFTVRPCQDRQQQVLQALDHLLGDRS